MTRVQLSPRPHSSLSDVSVPGSKSVTNRALILAAQQSSSVVLRNALRCDDTDAMCECLRTAGFTIYEDGDVLKISGKPLQSDTLTLNARLSGTTMRFLTTFALTLSSNEVILTGGEGLCKRPIKDLVDALRSAGAQIRYQNHEGFPPLIITPGPLSTDTVTIDGTMSSQYLSAILLSAQSHGIRSVHVNGDLVSKSYVELTITMLKEWGISIKMHKNILEIQSSRNCSGIKEYTIEGDYSAAGYFFALAVLLKESIKVSNLRRDSTQGDKQFLSILESMGNEVEWKDNAVNIRGIQLLPVEVSMEQCPDQAQTLSVLLAFARGTSVLTGLRTLRVKETERVKAVQTELKKMGIHTESPDQDTLIIHGGNPHSAQIDTYGDHRMAMSFAIAGSMCHGMIIRECEVVRKTVPHFWQLLASTGAVSIHYE